MNTPKKLGIIFSSDNGMTWTPCARVEIDNHQTVFHNEWYEENSWETNDILEIFTGEYQGKKFIGRYRLIPDGYSTYTYDPEESWQGLYVDEINEESMERFRRYILTEEERTYSSKLHRSIK